MAPIRTPQWMTLDTYVARTTWSEKLQRVANDLVVVTALVGTVAAYRGNIRGIARPIYDISLVLTVRKIIALIIGYSIHLCASPYPTFSKLEDRVAGGIEALQKQGYTVKPLSLWKSGNRFSGLVVTNPKIQNSGKWFIPALGNTAPFNNQRIEKLASEAGRFGCSTLIINPPSVNGSGGWPLPYQQGACYDAALSFLEEQAQAKKIIMEGHSLGGALLLKGVLAHAFKTESVSYMMISICTFSSLTKIASSVVDWILRDKGGVSERVANILSCLVHAVVAPILWLVGSELHSLYGAKKLSDLRIHHLVIQHCEDDRTRFTTDGIIPDRGGLAHGLRQADITHRTDVLENSCISHNHIQSHAIITERKNQIRAFLES